MPEIDHHQLYQHLSKLNDRPKSQLYLLFGEEFIYQSALEKILRALLPEGLSDPGCVFMEGSNENLAKALAEVNTYSLLSSNKVVALKDCKIFYSSQTKETFAEKTKKALADDEMKKAANYFMNYLNLWGMSLTDLGSQSVNDLGHPALAPFADKVGLARLIADCRENKLSPAEVQDSGELLQKAAEKGFPKGHVLVMTTDLIDKRRKLYKWIRDQGLAVDCSVPKGEKKADRQIQEEVLKETAAAILKARGKTMEPAALLAVSQLTGFDMRAFSQNIEKLTDYVGQRQTIVSADVEQVVSRSRQDPIFDFTNAMLERNALEAIFFLDSLLGQQIHPLQVLAALINQVRRLLLAKDFVDSEAGKAWFAGCPYSLFTARVLPALSAYDQGLQDLLAGWEKSTTTPAPDAVASGGSKKSGFKKKKSARSGHLATDLLLAKNPNNPYPIYQLLLRSDRFSCQSILKAMDKLSKVDQRLKTSGSAPRLLLEEAILTICKE
jgi:DNA polymerase-3 subunit delta